MFRGLKAAKITVLLRTLRSFLGLMMVPSALADFAVEESGFLLMGNDSERLLVVRTMLRGADQVWQERGIASVPTARAFPVVLKLDGDGADFEWSPNTSEEVTMKTIALRWLEMRLGTLAAQRQIEARPWVLDWMAGIFLSARSPTSRALWVARAGASPLPLDTLLDEATPSSRVVESQRWLLGEWWQTSAGAVDLVEAQDPLSKADWVAFFMSQRSGLGGPFLSLAQSSRRIETLGRVTLQTGDFEERVWLYSVPSALLAEIGSYREEQLRLLRNRIHPVYHRALLALIGAIESVSELSSFTPVFTESWSEAEETAAEIRGLLE